MPTIEETIKALEQLKKEIPTIVGNEAVTFFVRGFRNQGFTNQSLVLWKKGYKTAGATLVRAGHLRDSIEILSKTPASVTVGSKGVRYAKLHNEGAVLQITPKQRAYFWAMFYKLAKARGKLWQQYYKTGKDKTAQTAGLRNDQAEAYRRMALAKTLTFPKRQFIGESQVLEETLSKALAKRLNQLLK
jgi:phage gpG-like protein